ncbi:hypothetical protein [Aquibacillus kalidii]|uniref:hypothetical protein n=1 Tax=Aquibacillus kalidii TaxID=2762597 RepID=UPI001C997F39|nr:hypothetical protein [Aquibacillus kalidii]
MKILNSPYNYQLDTSNLYDDELNYEARFKEIKNALYILFHHFLKLGKTIEFWYWKGDLYKLEKGYPYTGYALHNFMEFPHTNLQSKDDLSSLIFEINLSIINSIKNSYKEDLETITPFFDITIYDISMSPILTSQDHGANVLMFLTNKDLLKLSNINYLIDEYVTYDDSCNDFD